MSLPPGHFISVIDRFIDDVTRSRLVWREWLTECQLGFWRHRQLAEYETFLCLAAYGVIYEEVSLLSGQKVNSFNWLQSSASSNRSGVAKIADWIGIFSNTVTERTCSNV